MAAVMLDIVYWILDIGYRTLDIGFGGIKMHQQGKRSFYQINFMTRTFHSFYAKS